MLTPFEQFIYLFIRKVKENIKIKLGVIFPQVTFLATEFVHQELNNTVK